jgi:hypothetical protein
LSLTVPALLVTLAAVPRIATGIALESAFPVPTYIAMNVRLPDKSYKAAATLLNRASQSDGDTQILRAEAVHLGGAPNSEVGPIIQNGLSSDPASSRGWTLLSETLISTNRARSAKALGIALELAPYDYYLAGRRARDGAALWDALQADSRELLIRQAALLWTEPLLHGEIMPTLSAPGGAALMARALSEGPDQIRKLNQWVARHRLGIGPQD